MSDIVIVSPHPDDEIISSFEILTNSKDYSNVIVVYTAVINETRKKEALNLKIYTNVKHQFFNRSIPPLLLNKENIFYFPDPVYETHPVHRLQGSIGEQLLRNGFNVIFYSINMQAPYCHEVVDPIKKETLLNKVYPSQKSMWTQDAKYYLFEGRCKWLM